MSEYMTKKDEQIALLVRENRELKADKAELGERLRLAEDAINDVFAMFAEGELTPDEMRSFLDVSIGAAIGVWLAEHNPEKFEEYARLVNDKALRKAQGVLDANQWTEDTGCSETDSSFGSTGCGLS